MLHSALSLSPSLSDKMLTVSFLLVCFPVLVLAASPAPPPPSHRLSPLPIHPIIDATGMANDQFGFSVSTMDNLAFVGSPGRPAAGIGSFFHFDTHTSTWIRDITFTDPTNDNDQFAYSSAFFRNSPKGPAILVAGAPYFSGSVANPGQGVVWMFIQSTSNPAQWSNASIIFPNDQQAFAFFGWKIAVSGDTMLIGSPGHTITNNGDGAAYFFSQNLGGSNRWGQRQMVFAPTSILTAALGSSVAIEGGGHALVGAPNDDYNSSLGSTGSAYLFGRNTGGPENWGLVLRLVNPVNPTSYEQFGASVAISGLLCFVGSPFSVTPGVGTTGAVFQFIGTSSDTWTFSNTMSLPSAQLQEQIGNYVAMQGSIAAICAQGVNTSAGIALFYQLESDGKTWSSFQTVADPAPAFPGDFFGSAVSIGNNFIIVSGTGKCHQLVKHSRLLFPRSLFYGSGC